MMQMEIKMPEYIDSLPQILWFESDEVGAAFIFFAIGLLMDHMFVGMAVAIVSVVAMKKIKSNALEGAAFHALCSTGIFSMNKQFSDLLKKDLFL